MKKKNVAILVAAIAVGLAVILAAAAVLVHISKGKNKNNDVVKPASGTAVIAIENVEAEAGKTVRVPITITDNPGFMGMLLQLQYDSDVLEYINIEQNGLFTDCDASDANGVVTLVDLENGDITGSGTLVYVNFKVKKGASGTSDLTLNIDENGVCNYEEKVIPCKAQNGVVTIS